MTTIKTLISQHRDTLDDKWKRKYPNGQFFWYKTKEGKTVYGRLLTRPTAHSQMIDKNLSNGEYVGSSFHFIEKHKLFSDEHKWKEWINKQTHEKNHTPNMQAP